MIRILLLAAVLTAPQAFAQDTTETLTDLSNFTLCELTLVDLKSLDKDIALVEINEMGFCTGQQTFDTGKGYVSKNYPGVIFQKETETERISKLHITSDFNGILPNGRKVNMSELNTDIVSEKLTDRKIVKVDACEKYNSFSENDMRFYFASSEEGVTAITGLDIVAECPRMAPINEVRNPIFFINGQEATQEQVGKLKPDDIKSFEVINADDAKKRYGDKGEFGVVLIKTNN
jgi:hypothetical protein